MPADPPVAKDIDEYIAGFPPAVQEILRRIRAIVREVAPDAVERISYRMPAFALDGIWIYFAAFKGHIGVYPPVRGNDRLNEALKPYKNEKGNLRFPFSRPIPYALIKRVVKALLEEHLERVALRRQARHKKRKTRSRAAR